jgi:hypothetical protein
VGLVGAAHRGPVTIGGTADLVGLHAALGLIVVAILSVALAAPRVVRATPDA